MKTCPRRAREYGVQGRHRSCRCVPCVVACVSYPHLIPPYSRFGCLSQARLWAQGNSVLVHTTMPAQSASGCPTILQSIESPLYFSIGTRKPAVVHDRTNRALRIAPRTNRLRFLHVAWLSAKRTLYSVISGAPHFLVLFDRPFVVPIREVPDTSSTSFFQSIEILCKLGLVQLRSTDTEQF